MTFGSRLIFQACYGFLFAIFLRQGCCFPPTSSSPKKCRRKNTEKKPNETNWFHRRGLLIGVFSNFRLQIHTWQFCEFVTLFGMVSEDVILSMANDLNHPGMLQFLHPRKNSLCDETRSEASFGMSCWSLRGRLNLGCNTWNPRGFFNELVTKIA